MNTNTPTTNLWDRQPLETGFAHAAFQTFLHLGPKSRSIQAAYFSWKNPQTATEEKLSKGVPGALPCAPTQWKQWSHTHQWLKRARAWDRQQSDVQVAHVCEQAIKQGLHFHAERQHNYLELHGVLQKSRENILANLREGQLSDRREKTTTRTPDGGWHTVETTTLMRLQCRLLEKLEDKIFPANRDIPTDENGDGLFRNFDTEYQFNTDTNQARPRNRPYDPPPVENLHIPQKVLDDNDPAKYPGSEDGAAFPPLTLTKPPHRA